MRKRYFKKSVRRVPPQIESENNYLPDAALILAFLTGEGYLVAFSYEKGYKGFYNLGEVFIGDIGIRDILISISSISTLFFLGYFLIKIFSEIAPKSDNPISLVIRYRLAPLSFVLIILMIANLTSKYGLLISFVSLLILIIWVFIYVPWENSHKTKGFKRRLEIYAKNIDRTPFVEKVILTYKYSKLWFFICLIFFSYSCCNLASLYGRQEAETKKDYYIVNQNKKNYVVVDFHEGKYILAPLDIKSSSIRSNFILIDGESQLSKPIIFKSYFFKNGLKVTDMK